MDMQTLLALAALHHKNGQVELANQVLAQTCTLEGFDSYVSDLIRRPMPSALVNGVQPSENTIAPSLHGSTSAPLEKVVAIAANIYAHNSRLDDGDYLEFSPSVEALAYVDGQDDGYDDFDLASASNVEEKPKVAFGRIEIKL
jgi:hypothetical protein